MITSFENREGLIWMNGKVIAWENATSHVISQGLHYASAVFEGERAYNGKIFKSEEHTKRLFKSAKIIGITCLCIGPTMILLESDLFKCIFKRLLSEKDVCWYQVWQ